MHHTPQRVKHSIQHTNADTAHCQTKLQQLSLHVHLWTDGHSVKQTDLVAREENVRSKAEQDFDDLLVTFPGRLHDRCPPFLL